jgi:Tol biopolymer transport system component
MTTDPVREAYEKLDADPARPTPEFAEDLFERLLKGTKLEGERHPRWRPTAPPPVRRWLVIAAALLIGALVLIPLLPLRDNETPIAPAMAPGIALVKGNGIVLIDPDSGAQSAQIPCVGCEPWAPAWSPDGSRIAFFARAYNSSCAYEVSCTPEPSADQGIYVADLGGAIIQLTRCTGACDGDQPFAWSPDGSRIAYVDAVEGGNQLRVVNLDGSNDTKLADYPGPSVAPTWSPDGASLAYAAHGKGLTRIQVLDLSSGTVTTVRRIPDEVETLAWSPDGSRVAFDRRSKERDSVVVMRADGSDPKPIALGGANTGPGVPTWSPDGSTLAFVATPRFPSGYGVEVWTARADGTNATRVFHKGCCTDGVWIIWSPDGRLIGVNLEYAQITLNVMNPDGTGFHRIADGGFGGAWRPTTG